MLNSAESPIEVAPVDFVEMGRDTNSRVDQAAVERSWRERVFSCGLWVDPPGQVWSPSLTRCAEQYVTVPEAADTP